MTGWFNRRVRAGLILPLLIGGLTLGGCGSVDIPISSLIFFPESKFDFEPADLNLAAEPVKLRPGGDVELFCWYLPPPKRDRVLLYIHGNAGNISHRLSIAKGWVDRGFGCFLLDYRGYGKSTGQIRHEKDLYADARAAYRWIRDERKVPADKIILYGESIGCAAAIELAREEKAGALILMAPFTKLIDVARVHYGRIVFESMVTNYQFDNESKIGSVRSPILIMQGTDDEIVPVEMGRRLFEMAPDPKESFWIEGGRHNDLPVTAGEKFWDRPAEFLDRPTR